jgi:acyl carrier protein
VLRVIAVKQRLPPEKVTPDSTFEELGIDSLDRLNLLFELEGEFDIQIDDEEAKKVTNMRGMIDGIQHLLEAKQQAAGAS